MVRSASELEEATRRPIMVEMSEAMEGAREIERVAVLKGSCSRLAWVAPSARLSRGIRSESEAVEPWRFGGGEASKCSPGRRHESSVDGRPLRTKLDGRFSPAPVCPSAVAGEAAGEAGEAGEAAAAAAKAAGRGASAEGEVATGATATERHSTAALRSSTEARFWWLDTLSLSYTLEDGVVERAAQLSCQRSGEEGRKRPDARFG